MDYNSVTQFYLILTTTIIPRDSPGRDFYIPRTRDIAPKREGDMNNIVVVVGVNEHT